MRCFDLPNKISFVLSLVIILLIWADHVSLLSIVTPKNLMLSSDGNDPFVVSILIGFSIFYGQKLIVEVLVKFKDSLFALNQFSRLLKSCCRM